MARRKSSSGNDPFGFGSGSFGNFDLGLDNFQKRQTLANNRMKGRMAEDSFAFEQRIQGNDCTRIHKGGDYVVQKRDFFGNKVGKPTVHEIKTGNSQLSDAQKKKQKRMGKSRYQVDRYY